MRGPPNQRCSSPGLPGSKFHRGLSSFILKCVICRIQYKFIKCCSTELIHYCRTICIASHNYRRCRNEVQIRYFRINKRTNSRSTSGAVINLIGVRTSSKNVDRHASRQSPRSFASGKLATATRGRVPCRRRHAAGQQESLGCRLHRRRAGLTSASRLHCNLSAGLYM